MNTFFQEQNIRKQFLSNSTRKLLWYEITKMLDCMQLKKFIASFITIFGKISFPIPSDRRLNGNSPDNDIVGKSVVPRRLGSKPTQLSRRPRDGSTSQFTDSTRSKRETRQRCSAGSAPDTPLTMDSPSLGACRRLGHDATNTTKQGVILRATTQ